MENISKEIGRKLAEKLQSGEITINEARQKMGLTPIEKGDMFVTKVQSDNSAETD